MEEAKEAIKKAKDFIVKYPKRIAQAIIVIVFGIVLFILAGATYVVKRDDGSYKEDDWSSTPYGAGQYIEGVSVNDNGTLKNGLNSQELWDKMLEEGCRVDKYLDTPEELARLMKAEIVTQYPDTRPRDQLDTPIDWDKVIEEADTLQGIIKFKRANSDGNTSNLAYVDPTTFQSYIDEYNDTGSEAAKQKALSHFTLKKGNPASSTIIPTNANKDNNNNENKKDKDNKDSEDKDNKNKEKKQTAVETPVEGDGYSKEYTSSAGITYRHYKQGTNTTNGRRGSYCDNPYWSGTIATSGCGPTSVSILASGLMDNAENYTPGVIAAQMKQNYGLTSYATLQQQMNSLGMMSVVMHSPSAERIQENLRNGKVMLVSVNSATRFTGNSHIMALVDINEAGQVYICNPSNTGEGWFDISEIMKGCNYIVVTDAGATGIAPAGGSSTSGGTTVGAKRGTNYTAVVATWQQVNTTITTDDPNVEASSNTQYTMLTTDVNYEALVQPYTMPFDLLWALLVIGQDKNFIFELTDLIYGSDIQITIHDNLTENTIVEDWNYTKRTKAKVDAFITARCDGNSSTGSIVDDVHDPDSEDNYNTKKTVVTKTNTLKTDLSRANVWIIDYKKDYTYQAPEETTSNNTVTKDNEEYPNDPESTGSTYSCEHIDDLKARLKERVIKLTEDNNEDSDDESEKSSSDVTYSEEINVEYYSKYVNIVNNITNTTKTQKYTEGAPKVIEKIDEETAPNFVTIFNDGKYSQNNGRIRDGDLWLFEIMEINPGTTNMVDTIKYLLNKAGGSDRYKLPEGFRLANQFRPGNIATLSNGGILNTGDLEETVWFTLKNLGYNEYAIAGAMGNLYYESDGFVPERVQYGLNENNGGIGLAQWTGGRNTQLKAYAASKGKEWKDGQIQVEFLIGELNRVGDAVPYTDYQFFGKYVAYAEQWKSAGNLDDATKYFCLSFERCSEENYYGSITKRIKAAQDYYNTFHGKEAPSKNNAEGSSDSPVVREARGALGVPYVWGGESYTGGMDCSGLVKVCYERAYGITLPHYTGALMADSHFTTVGSINELTAGDIILSPGHVVIYTGEGTIIHEPRSGDVCKEVSLDDYFRTHKNCTFRHYNQ